MPYEQDRWQPPYDNLRHYFFDMPFSYQHGFSNHFSSEAVGGALPLGRNSPQRAPKGLYAEVLSGTAFTTPRAENRSSWLYRLRPSAMPLTRCTMIEARMYPVLL